MLSSNRIYLFSLVAIFMLVSCRTENTTTETETMTIESQSNVLMIESDENNIAPCRPMNGALFFDISYSTQGYLDSNSPEFRGVISQFGRLLAIRDYYLYGTTPQLSNGDTFQDLLNTGKFNWSGGSDINSMFKFMVQQVKSKNDVVCLISDGIMSGTNKQIQQNPQYNVQNKEALMNQIKSTLEVLDDSYSALIVRYVSPFKGTYYCYNNANKTLNCSRPYFAIVIAKWNQIKWIEQDLILGKAEGKSESYYKYSDLVMIGDALSYANCKFGPKTTNITKVDSLFKVLNQDSIAFVCPIKDLAPFMQTDAYFRDNFQLLKQRRGQTEFTIVPSEKYNLYVDTQRKKVIVSFHNAISTYVSGNTLQFKLRYASPNWINEYSDENDLTILNDSRKKNQTFNLKYLIGGFSVLNDNDVIIQNELAF